MCTFHITPKYWHEKCILMTTLCIGYPYQISSKCVRDFRRLNVWIKTKKFPPYSACAVCTSLNEYTKIENLYCFLLRVQYVMLWVNVGLTTNSMEQSPSWKWIGSNLVKILLLILDCPYIWSSFFVFEWQVRALSFNHASQCFLCRYRWSFLR
jgi:hypothetical protein